MTGIEERFAGNGDDWYFVDRQLFRRSDMKRKSRPRPTKNRVVNLTPLRFCWYFNNDSPRLVAGRVCQRDVNVAVYFNFQSNDATSKREPLIFSRDAFLLIAL